MRTVDLVETEARDFLAGSDGAYYTPVEGVEAKCSWCRRWGHPVGLYHREVLFRRKASLVCERHVRRGDDLRAS